MTKFEGKINGIDYTDEKEFFDDLSKLNKTGQNIVSNCNNLSQNPKVFAPNCRYTWKKR